VPQKLDPQKSYKRDMDLTVNGHHAEGMLVVPRASKYDFKIIAKGKLDLFTFTTCHREQTKENAGESGWFSDSKKRELSYVPTPLEAGEISCPVQLGGYEKKKGRHSWGLVEFEHPSLSMPAKIECNGSVMNATGVSVCQSKAGLLERISFSEKMLTSSKGSCPQLKSNDGKVFQFEIQKGQCVYRFLTMAGKKRYHRLLTFGYEKILIRDN